MQLLGSRKENVKNYMFYLTYIYCIHISSEGGAPEQFFTGPCPTCISYVHMGSDAVRRSSVHCRDKRRGKKRKYIYYVADCIRT